MTQAERLQKIDAIRKLPDLLEATVAGLTDAQLDTPYRAGGWTVRQVVHHLADSHMNAFVRAKLILTEDHPTVKPYDQDKWAELVDTKRLPVRSSLALVRGLHERWTALLESLPEEAWSRSAKHPEIGEITLERILTIYSGHGEKHVETIRTLRTTNRW
jgi:hypothetical protein